MNLFAPLAEIIADPGLLERCRDLETGLSAFPSALVAFSGGADSALLAAMARRVLGRDRAKACIAVGPSLPDRELRAARELAESLDLELAEFAATEGDNPAYAANGPDRCYHCKADLFSHLVRIAADAASAAGPAPALLYGGNLDDTYDYRPGRKAAAEAGARAPLAEAGLAKADVRALSRALGLPTADKPAQPCLSSRIPYGQAVTPEKLAAVEAGEEILAGFGFREFRVRHFGTAARIEVAQGEREGLTAGIRAELANRLGALGFDRVDFDSEGFRSGRLNEALAPEARGRAGGTVSDRS
ncbi:MAG: ATP-dependent sacrificial sulfur transferase LarE [Fibrobacteres bacterium]|nr:ATP-dependent sacrificial sulfur transferase LarE [Fibrobacterota bacterium]